MSEILPDIDINQVIQAPNQQQNNIKSCSEEEAKQVQPQSERNFSQAQQPPVDQPKQQKGKESNPEFGRTKKIVMAIGTAIFCGMIISLFVLILISLKPQIKQSKSTQQVKLNDGSTLAVTELVMEIKNIKGEKQNYQVIHTQAVSIQKNKSLSATSNTINFKDLGILVNINPNSTMKIGVQLQKFSDYINRNSKNKNQNQIVKIQGQNLSLEQKFSSKLNKSLGSNFNYSGKVIDLIYDQDSFCFDRVSRQYRQCSQQKERSRNLQSLQNLTDNIDQEIISQIVNKITKAIHAMQQILYKQNSQQNYEKQESSSERLQKLCFALSSDRLICDRN